MSDKDYTRITSDSDTGNNKEFTYMFIIKITCVIIGYYFQ